MPRFSWRSLIGRKGQSSRIRKLRCGACLFELSEDAKPLSSDLAFDEMFIPSRVCNPNSLSSRIGLVHLEQLSKLIESAERGCRTCGALKSVLKWSEEPLEATLYWKRGRLFLCSQGQSKPIGQKDYQIFVVDDEESPSAIPLNFHPFVDTGSFPSGDTRSPAAFDKVMRLMGQCMETHGKCAAGLGGTTMPERILFIQDLTPLRVRLIENARNLPIQPYACLSHRWGPSTRSSSLTRDSTKSFQAMIPEDKLYPILRDSMEICHRLGLRYLWIDCLCIYQDDLKDWEGQAAEMDTIYENATLTISALSCSANSLDRGIFVKKPPLPASHLTKLDGKTVLIKHIPKFSHPFRSRIDDPEGLDYTVTSSEAFSLNARGWVYQEQLLSRRVIHFTEEELIWVCRESFKCECRFEEHTWGGIIKSQFNDVPSMDWKHIVSVYSRRDLSFESDRLPALSGIAKRFGTSNKRTYLAGLWWEDLYHQLLWISGHPILTDSGHQQRGTDRQIPSWSWVSVTGSVHFFPAGAHKLIDLISYEVSYGTNHYGVPSCAKLILEGPCTPAIIQYGEDWSKEIFDRKVILIVAGMELILRPDYDFSAPGDGALPSGTEVVFLMHSEGLKDKEGVFVTGLVLICVDPFTEFYQRIGHAYSGSSPTQKKVEKLGLKRWITLV